MPGFSQDLIDDSAYASRWTPLEGTAPAQVRVVWTERADREALVQSMRICLFVGCRGYSSL